MQRWEKGQSLPVHRLHLDKRGSIYAFTDELDRWWEQRDSYGDLQDSPVDEGQPEQNESPAEEAMVASRRWPWIVALASVLIIGLGSGWLLRQQVLTGRPVVAAFTNLPGDEETPALSPDGSQVAFSWNGENRLNYDIYIKKVGAGELKRITTADEWDYSPAWSPDGNSIAFLRAMGKSRAQLFVISPNGGPERKLLDTKTTSSELAWKRKTVDWSPDGKWLVLSGTDVNEPDEGLLLVSVETGAVRRLTNPPARQFDFEPAFSPDGRALLFVRVVGDSILQVEMLKLTPDLIPMGTEIPILPGKTADSPQWTANGKEILLVMSSRIWKVAALDRPTSQEPREIRDIVRDCSFVSVSGPSARANRLVYTCESTASTMWRLDLTSAQGSPGQLRRIGPLGRSNAAPQASLYGGRIAFESVQSGVAQIWTSNLDGSDARAITKAHTGVMGSPSWSPDGRWIAFDSRSDGRAAVYIADANGDGARRLAAADFNQTLPSWSRDAKRIYFSANQGGRYQIWRAPVSGGPAEQITREGGTASVESPDGQSIYYERREKSSWSLRQCQLDGSADREILDNMNDRSFVVVAKGIYFVPMAGTDGRSSIQFRDFANGQTSMVLAIQKPQRRSLAVSPDGKSLLFSQFDHWGRDLMIVDQIE